MSEVKKIATRDSYGNALVELGKKYENLVVLDADLAGATKTGTFQKAFPERHIDCGIAESNMMGIAAGLSTTGKVVTVEEHSVIGGLGGAVAEVLSEKAPTKMLRIGINDVFGESGPAVKLLEKYGIDAAGIYEKVKAFM